MKTTKYIIAAFSLILGLSSCYDLDVAPYDKVAQGNYWKTCLLYTSPSPRD